MNLSDLRDLLFPGLWSYGCPKEYESDILLSHRRQSLFVMFHNLETGRGITREITRENIADGSYKAKFSPILREMIAEISE